MAGGIGDDKFAFGGGEVAIGDVDRDALFAFGFESIGDECGVKFAADGTVGFAFVFELGKLIFVEHFGVEEETSNEGTFAVVDTSAGDEAEEFLTLVLFEVSVNVGCNEVALMGHVRSSLVSFSLPYLHRLHLCRSYDLDVPRFW